MIGSFSSSSDSSSSSSSSANNDGEGLSDLTIFTLAGALKTHNPMIDIAVAILLPIVIKALFDTAKHLFAVLQAMFSTESKKVAERSIIYVSTRSSFYVYRGEDDFQDSNKNGLLVNAVLLYAGTFKDFLCSTKSNMDFRVLREKKIDEDHNATETPSEYISSTHKLITAPINAIWHNVTDEIRIKMLTANNSQSTDKGSSTTITTTLTIQSRTKQGELGASLVENFIKDSISHYLETLRQAEVGGRFYYSPIIVKDDGNDSNHGGGGGGGGGRGRRSDKSSRRVFKKYALSSAKTFDSMFFSKKEKLLHLIDLFKNKQGRYEIKGCPYKLGFLLYGPPGTGKTSVIKAMAAYLDRSIVNVPLSQIKTNQELSGLFFDGIYPTLDDSDAPQRLGLDRVIFVVEDIDAMSKIVHARSNSAKPKVTTTVESSETEIAPGKFTRTVSVRSERIPETTADEEKDYSSQMEQQQKEQQQQQQILALATLMSSATSGISDDKDQTVNAGFLKSFSGFGQDKSDELNLSGILNVLDGVVDSPGRIVIFTSNHPEKLDPALIRPGRIDHIIHLGFMDFDNLIGMVKHFYRLDKIHPDLVTRMQNAFIGQNISRTPAEYECRILEYDSVEEFCEWMELNIHSSRSDGKFRSW